MPPSGIAARKTTGPTRFPMVAIGTASPAITGASAGMLAIPVDGTAALTTPVAGTAMPAIAGIAIVGEDLR